MLVVAAAARGHTEYLHGTLGLAVLSAAGREAALGAHRGNTADRHNFGEAARGGATF